ncbi:MAG: NADH dehydrogenase FAD-containing subunit [Planctomycetes bacterium]|nr:NADH dehydrogenase FAD-containing subunit [Planctomycetota bacterium]
MIVALILLPTLAAVTVLAVRSATARRTVLVLVALGHAALTVAAFVRPPAPALGGWLVLDDLGRVFLAILSLLFLAASLYGVGYLAREARRPTGIVHAGFLATNQPEAVFTCCLLLFLATMTLVTVSHSFGLLWVAVEATTLASAPLIYFHRQKRSLEATWKYLLVCSVGIAVALLGNFFLAIAATRPDGQSVPLVLGDLLASAAALDVNWLKAAFLLFLVGYGTKMGLAPLHTWLPDAHSEAPSMVSALLSGALLNCALLALLRIFQVCGAAGLADFTRPLMILFGLLSMAVAAVFIIHQEDFKRMLAYSSVEHMGLLALGIGLGGAAGFGAMLHALNHSLTKGMLFLVAGNILAAYRTKTIADTGGIVRVLPISGVLWIAGFLAISGSPPFGPFVSELVVIKAAFDQHAAWVAVAILALLGIIFIGMAAAMLRMVYGTPPGDLQTGSPPRQSRWTLLPPAALGILVLMLGLYVPPVVEESLRQAARALGGN